MFGPHAVDGLFMLRGLFLEFSSESGDVTLALFVKLDLRQKKKKQKYLFIFSYTSMSGTV